MSLPTGNKRSSPVRGSIGFPWKPERFGPLLLCEITKLKVCRTKTTPTASAYRNCTRAADAAPEHNYYPKQVSFPATAFFRFEGGLAEPAEPRTGRLELYNPLTIQAIQSAAGRCRWRPT